MQVMLGKTFKSFKVADNSNLIQKETFSIVTKKPCGTGHT